MAVGTLHSGHAAGVDETWLEMLKALDEVGAVWLARPFSVLDGDLGQGLQWTGNLGWWSLFL